MTGVLAASAVTHTAAARRERHLETLRQSNLRQSRNRSLYRSFTTQILPLPQPKGDFSNKTILITGGNVGLGLEAARHFLKLKAKKIILGCRDLAKGNAAKEDLLSTPTNENGPWDADQIEVWPLDLASFTSTKSFCRRASTSLDRLDILVASAGLLSIRHDILETGHERVITVNFLSTWLLILSLLPLMKATGAKYYYSSNPQTQPEGEEEEEEEGKEEGKEEGGRGRGGGEKKEEEDAPHVVIVGSNAHFYTAFPGRHAPSILDFYKRGEDLFHLYADAKLMSLMACREVAARLPILRGSVVMNTVDPGTCLTQLMREDSWPWYWSLVIRFGFGIIGRTAEMGARNYVAAATAGWESHGGYVEDCALSTPHEFVTSGEGGRVQKRVFEELMGVLEEVEPGISGNI
ncbi:NAD(P)-binding protein [Xylariomycetidae sp. FL2044]|nr:NAD(P)-binding protein [Xylariomycetidae sp. FL2044]